jgi:hypothetical protein
MSQPNSDFVFPKDLGSASDEAGLREVLRFGQAEVEASIRRMRETQKEIDDLDAQLKAAMSKLRETQLIGA